MDPVLVIRVTGEQLLEALENGVYKYPLEWEVCSMFLLNDVLHFKMELKKDKLKYDLTFYNLKLKSLKLLMLICKYNLKTLILIFTK